MGLLNSFKNKVVGIFTDDNKKETKTTSKSQNSAGKGQRGRAVSTINATSNSGSTGSRTQNINQNSVNKNKPVNNTKKTTGTVKTGTLPSLPAIKKPQDTGYHYKFDGNFGSSVDKPSSNVENNRGSFKRIETVTSGEKNVTKSKTQQLLENQLRIIDFNTSMYNKYKAAGRLDIAERYKADLKKSQAIYKTYKKRYQTENAGVYRFDGVFNHTDDSRENFYDTLSQVKTQANNLWNEWLELKAQYGENHPETQKVYELYNNTFKEYQDLSKKVASGQFVAPKILDYKNVNSNPAERITDMPYEYAEQLKQLKEDSVGTTYEGLYDLPSLSVLEKEYDDKKKKSDYLWNQWFNMAQGAGEDDETVKALYAEYEKSVKEEKDALNAKDTKKSLLDAKYVETHTIDDIKNEIATLSNDKKKNQDKIKDLEKLAEQRYRFEDTQKEQAALDIFNSNSEERQKYIEKGKANKVNPLNNKPKFASNADEYDEYGQIMYNILNASDTEKDYFNFIYGYFADDNQKAYDTIKDYYQNKSVEEIQKKADESKTFREIGTPVGSVEATLLSPIYYTELGINKLKNKITGDYKPLKKTSLGTQIMQTKDAFEDAYVGDSEGAERFFRQGFLSIANNTTNIAVSAATGVPTLGLAMTGAQSAASSAYDVIKRGGTEGQALTYGAISGTLEILTEKLPFDKVLESLSVGKAGLKSVKNIKELYPAVIKLVGKQAFEGAITEYGEETVNSYLSTIADIAINKENSDYTRYVKDLQANGASYEDALNAATKKFFLTDPQMAGLSGAFSGALMNTGALTIGLTSNTAKAYKEGKGQLIIQTDAKLSKEQLNKYRDFVKKTGKNVVLEDIAHTEVTNDDGSVTNYRTLGETDSDDTIRVNMNELDSLVEEHELSHTLENTPGFKDFKKIVLDTIYQTDDAKRNDDINKVKEKYGENADSREKAENEIVAEFVRKKDLLSQIPDNKIGSIKRMLTSLKAKASRLSKSKNSTDAETLKATNELISQFEKVLNKSKKMSLTEAIARGNTSLYSPYIDENGKVRFNNGEIGKEKGESKYLIKYDTDGNPFVEIEEDILKDVPKEKWSEVFRNKLKEKFPEGFKIGNRQIKINNTSRGEMLGSEYSQMLLENNEQRFKDKLSAAYNTDELWQTQVNPNIEDPNHERKDNYVNFVRGYITFKVGENAYTGELITGITTAGNEEIYDIVNIKETKIKEDDQRLRQQSAESTDRSSSTPSIPYEVPKVKTAMEIALEKAGVNDSIFRNGENDTGKSKKLLGDTVKIEKGYVTGEFNNVVDAVFKGDINERLTVKIGDTPKILRDYGADDNPLTISQTEMYKIAYPKGYLGLKQGHNLGVPALKHLPEQIADPVAILKSNTQKDKGRVILTEWNDKNNNPVIIALHINQQGSVEVENVIKSAYGKKNIEALLGENNENVIFTKNNEDIQQLLTVRLQLPEANTEDIFNNNLSQSEEIVNNNSMQNSENNSSNSKKLLGEEVLPGAETEINETAKSRAAREKAENKLVKDLSSTFSVPLGESREFLKPIVQEITNEYLTTGKISSKTINKLFEEGYKNGKIINDGLYTEYSALREKLRDTKIKVSDDITADISDYGDFRRRHMGSMTLSKNDGIEVDSIYEELMAEYPEFFDKDTANSADRLLKIAEVSDSLKKKIETLDTYYQTDESKADLKHEFESSVSDMIESMIKVKRFNDAIVNEKSKIKLGMKDKERYEVLKDKTLNVAQAKPVQTENIDDSDLEALKSKYKKEAKPVIKKLAEEFGVFKSYKNDDVDIEFEFTHGSLRESINKQHKNYDAFGKMLTVFDEVVSNAVGIETHEDKYKGTEREDKRLKQAYVLASAFSDGNDIYPVRLTVKEFKTDETNKLYVAICLNKTEDTFSEQAGKQSSISPPYSPASSKISLAQLFKNVNNADEDLIKYIPKQFRERSSDEILEVHNKLYKAQKASEKVMANELLTDKDKTTVDRLIKGEIGFDEIPKDADTALVKKAYEAKKQVADLQAVIDEHNKQVRTARDNEINKYLEDSDNWKDKKRGISYATETAYRNALDVSNGDTEFANKFFNTPEENEAKKVRFINYYIKQAGELKLNNAECTAVQYLGETEFEISQLEALEKAGKLNKRKQVELNRMRAEVNNFRKNNGESSRIDFDKVDNGIKFFRETYEKVYKLINETRIRNGYAPIGYIEGYFPHFISDESDTPFRKMMSDLGFEVETNKRSGKFEKLKNVIGIGNEVTELPTNIAGKTENFKPGITWNPNALRRLGKKTDFDAYYGFEKYITGAADVIFHTDDIQNIRALEKALRYKYSDEGIKERINEVKNDTNMTEEDRQSELNKIFESKGALLTKMGHFANYLTDYGNQLANKKSRYDRLFENELGRKVYNVFNRLNNNFAANAIVGNVASAATNIIPIQQMRGSVKEKYILKGICYASHTQADDYVLNNSTFITNRKGTEKLVKSMSDEMELFLSKPMEWVDMFTAKTVVKARFEQNVAEGMTKEEALKEADRFAANLIASRTKASMPTIFGAKNPLFKSFTAFQVEVRNQYSYLFKDLPKEQKDKGVAALAWAFFKIMLGSYLFNDVYEYFFGRRPATDVLGTALGMAGETTGYKLNTWPEFIEGILKGEGIESAVLKVKKQDEETVVKNGAKELAQEIPFFGSLIGGGRISGFSQPLGDFWENAKKIPKAKDILNKENREDYLKQTIADTVIPLGNFVLPYGYGQLTKTAKGIKTLVEGGSYKVDTNGDKHLQYPVKADAENIIKGVVGGKSATDGYKQWQNNGFTSLSPEETKIYEQMIGDTTETFGNALEKGQGADKYNVYNVMMGIKNDDINKEKPNQVHEYIQSIESTDGLNDKQKSELEYLYLSYENQNKIYWLKKKGNMSTKRALQMRYDMSPNFDNYETEAKARAEYYKEVIPENTRQYIASTTYQEPDADLERFALLYNKDYTAKEKAAYDDAFVSKLKRKRDYSSENAYFYSMLSENQQKRYDKQKNYIKKLNMMSYFYYLKEANDKSHPKKADKIRVLMDNGMTRVEAVNFYLRVMSSSKKYQ